MKPNKEACPECSREYNPSYLRKHRREKHGVRSRSSRVAPEVHEEGGPLEGLGLDIILQQLYPHGIPTDKIPAVVRWLDASLGLTK